jgi:hypothetical protein
MSSYDPGQLDPETRALLARARGMDEPSDEQRSRVLKGLEVSLAAAATTGIASSALALTGKAVVTVLALSVASLGTWYAVRSRPGQQSESHRVEHVEKPVESPVRTPEPELLEPAQEAAPVLEQASERAQEQARPRRVPKRKTAKQEASLQAETELLRTVHAAINRGDGAGALELLHGYERRFDHGLLREEKSAASVLALCVAGRAERARVEAQRFVQRYPHSPLLARLQTSCAASALKVAP